MEYLPEKKRTQQAQVRKKDAKLKDFREFLADKEVVLALVKYLLSMRCQKELPANPQDHLVDFFGQYRDPMWDRMDEWTAEMDELRNCIPGLEDKVAELESKIAVEKRKTFALQLYQQADVDVTDALGYKLLIQKLSGQAKYDLDTKISRLQFFHLMEEQSQIDVPVLNNEEPPVANVDGAAATEAEPVAEAATKKVFDQVRYDQIQQAWNSALSSDAANPPFTGDLQNPTYVLIEQAMRDFKPEDYPNPEVEPAAAQE